MREDKTKRGFKNFVLSEIKLVKILWRKKEINILMIIIVFIPFNNSYIC